MLLLLLLFIINLVHAIWRLSLFGSLERTTFNYLKSTFFPIIYPLMMGE